MQDCQHVYLIFQNVEDDPVWLHQYFAHCRILILGNHPTGQLIFGETFRAPCYAIHGNLSVSDRTLGDVIVDANEVVIGSFRKVYIHDFSPNCARTSAIVSVFPSRLSLSPRSIA